ncbi:hypothetical protein GQ457_17G010880 [Hibiscus cannabinus]
MGEKFREIKSTNATVWGWSERMQMEKGDSLKPGHISEVTGYTPIVSKQNDLQEMKKIWQRWKPDMSQSFQEEYRDITLLFGIQIDIHLLRALTQFWNPGYNCFTFGIVDMTPTIEEYTALLRCLRIKEGKVYIKPKESLDPHTRTYTYTSISPKANMFVFPSHIRAGDLPENPGAHRICNDVPIQDAGNMN